MTLRPSLLLWLPWSLFAWVGVPVAAPAQGWVDRTGPNGPSARGGHAMCYDVVRGYVLMVGQPAGAGTPVADTWSWDGTTWTQRGSAPVATVGTPPFPPGYVPFGQYAMATHGATGDVFLAVESACQSQPTSIFTWTGASWTSLASGVAGGSGCNTNQRIAMGYDPVRSQTVLFSVSDPTSVSVFENGAWTIRSVTSAPVLTIGADSHVAMAFDPAAGKLVLVCSSLYLMTYPVRVYEWNGYGWNQRLPVNLPPMGIASMSTDIVRGRVVAMDSDAYSSVPRHTWSYSNGVMTQLAPPIEPSLRISTAMAFDLGRGVHVLFGGFHSSFLADTWEFDLGPLASFTPYGAGCAGSRGVPQLVALGGSLPRVGETFSTRASNLPWTGPALMLLGVSDTSYSGTPLPANLAMLNAPGCFLRTSIEDVQPLQNVLGTATWSFVIPPIPGATFFLQALPFDPVANPLGLTLSNGGRAVVGL